MSDQPTPDSSQPLSQEQMAFFTAQTERAVEKGVKRGVRNYRNGALAGFLVLFIGIGAAFVQRDHDQTARRQELVAAQVTQTRAIRAAAIYDCNVAFSGAENFRALLKRLDDANAVSYRRGVIKADQRRAARRFYTSALKQLKLPDCRQPATLISTDPDQPIPVVLPRYPGDVK